MNVYWSIKDNYSYFHLFSRILSCIEKIKNYFKNYSLRLRINIVFYYLSYIIFVNNYVLMILTEKKITDLDFKTDLQFKNKSFFIKKLRSALQERITFALMCFNLWSDYKIRLSGILTDNFDVSIVSRHWVGRIFLHNSGHKTLRIQHKYSSTL